MKEAYRIKCGIGDGRGGTRWKAVLGEILCDGLFGVHDVDSESYGDPCYVVTHIPTGRRIAFFGSRGRAKRCAGALARLALPWHLTTTRAWRAADKDEAHLREMKRLVEVWGGSKTKDEALGSRGQIG